MSHTRHLLVCAVLMVAVIALVIAGAGAVAFIPALGCAAMMGVMVWMMVRAGGRGHR